MGSVASETRVVYECLWVAIVRADYERVLVRNAAGRLFSERTGEASYATADGIAALRARTGTTLPDAELEAMLVEMATARGMTMIPDL